MGVRRVVPDLTTNRLDETRAFYQDVFGFEVGMDLGWIVTLVSPDNPTAQLSLFPGGERIQPHISIEVDDVDAVHEEAMRAGHDVVYGPTDEDWGVRRFFVRDPGGVIVNVLSHREG